MNVNYPKVLVAIIAAVILTSASARASEMDERIESAVKNSYVFKTYLKNDVIQTQVKDGFVTLRGTVDEESHKSLAKETVASMPEVKGVDIQLELTGARLADQSDEWIRRRVKSSLLYNRQVSGLSALVSVTEGIVTLRGEANSQAQKDLIGEYAKDIEGVKDVKNEMIIAQDANNSSQTMAEKMDDASITAQVRLALLSRHSTSVFKTEVATINGEVTLSGKATSKAGKDLVTKVAKDVKGVMKVTNNMIVEDSL